MARNEFNSIMALTLLDGSVSTDVEVMGRAVVEYFQSTLAPARL